jgi:hypothetical protein
MRKKMTINNSRRRKRKGKETDECEIELVEAVEEELA